MKKLMRCLFCGLLQDEPEGVKACQRCGGELAFETPPPPETRDSYLQALMELDQIHAPAGQMVDRHIIVSLKTPKNVPEAFLAKTESGRPQLCFNVVLDVSGSMRGAKIEHTRQALNLAARLLHKGDQLAMTIFSEKASVVMKPRPFNSHTQKQFESVVAEIGTGGRTALYDGLALGLKQARRMKSENTLTLLLSDGQANVGETDLELVGLLAKEAAEEGMVVSTLGVGQDYNEALMTEIATQGRGRFYHVQSADEIVPYLTGELGEAADLAANDVMIRINLPEGAALIPLSAVYVCEVVDQRAVVSIGDIPVDLDVEIPLRLTLYAGKPGARLAVDGDVVYTTPSGDQLAESLNPVAVRFLGKNQYKKNLGVVEPVAVRVAHQMQARQVLNFSRAFTRQDKEEIKKAEQARERFQEYLQLLDEDHRRTMIRETDQDFAAVRSASHLAKGVINQAYKRSRFMRDLDDKK
jgi:Ca-activated chloride channel family protein